MAHVGNRVFHLGVAHEFEALLENDLTLIIHHVVELENVFSCVEVACLDFLLCLLKRLVDPRMDDSLAFLQAKLLQHAVHAVRPEDAHQIVVEREEELRMARVPLTPGTSAQLVVDAPAFMTLRTDDVKPARIERDLLFLFDIHLDLLALGVDLLLGRYFALGFLFGSPIFDQHVEVAAKLNVSAASGHIRRNGYGARHTGLSNDVRFLLMISGVQDLDVLDLFLAHQSGKVLGFLNRSRADQNRLFAFPAILDELDDGSVFFVRRTVDLIMVVNPDHVLVGWNFQNVEPVDVHELIRFCHGGTGHACEFFIKAEIVLEGNRRHGLVFRLDGDVFLCFQCLVQAFGVASAFHHAAGELVDNHHLVVFDDVVFVTLKQLMRAQRLVHVMDNGHIFHVV